MSESENLDQSSFFQEGSTTLDLSRIIPEDKRAENMRGELLGQLASGEEAYDKLKGSHAKDHPEVIPLLEYAFTHIEWNPETKEDEYTAFMIPLESSQGKSEVAPVPNREGVRIVYATRLDHKKEPRKNPDGSLMYSRWVIGLTEDEIPESDKLKVVLNMPPNQTENKRWVQVITAHPAFEDVPQEAGGLWKKYRERRNAALAYWENIGPDGNPVDPNVLGRAFIYDESKMDTSNILPECPYDRTPDLVQ